MWHTHTKQGRWWCVETRATNTTASQVGRLGRGPSWMHAHTLIGRKCPAAAAVVHPGRLGAADSDHIRPSPQLHHHRDTPLSCMPASTHLLTFTNQLFFFQKQNHFCRWLVFSPSLKKSIFDRQTEFLHFYKLFLEFAKQKTKEIDKKIICLLHES